MVVDQQTDPRFQALLADFDTDSLANNEATIYGLWPDLTLAFVNHGWSQFAACNGAAPTFSEDWPLGRCILDCLPDVLRSFYVEHYLRCLKEGRPWEHLYDCSSAELYRQLHMISYPLGHEEGLLVINSVRREGAHTTNACPPLDELYRNDHGIATQCSHCRRMRRSGMETTWDWVPAWVEMPPANISHGLCEPCVGFHYAPRRAGLENFARPFWTRS